MRCAALGSIVALVATILAPGVGAAAPAHRGAKLGETTITVPAHESRSFDVTTLGVPRYGAEDLTVTITAASGDLSGASVSPEGAADGYGEEIVDLSNASSGQVTPEPGLRGAIDLENPSADPLVVTVSADDWSMKERAIAASEEADFVAKAAEFGVDPAIAKMAVWDEQMADSIPTRVVVSEGTTPTRAVTARDAASGSCAGAAQLETFNRSFAFYSDAGKIWDTSFTKRWCRTPGKKTVNSGFFLLREPRFTGLGSTSYDFKGNINIDDRFTSYGGSAQGAHWSTATHHIKQCMVIKIPYCDDVYHQYWVTGNYDGSKNGGWPSGANPT